VGPASRPAARCAGKAPGVPPQHQIAPVYEKAPRHTAEHSRPARLPRQRLAWGDPVPRTSLPEPAPSPRA
ncbi:hypothetical protein J0687_25300, partial [Vibrio alginolyticus]|nr:hypothetical protein [Vibrio alginolyticus]